MTLPFLCSILLAITASVSAKASVRSKMRISSAIICLNDL